MQIRKLISSEPCNERLPVEELQPIHEHPSVVISGKLCLEALVMVDTGSSLHNPQIVPERDALTIRSPVSLPQMSGKTSNTGNK
jgi:hypothetical protein